MTKRNRIADLLHLGTIITIDPQTGIVVRVLDHLAEDQMEPQWMDECVLRRRKQLTRKQLELYQREML